MRDDKLIDYYRARAKEYEQIYYRNDETRRSEIEAHCTRLATLATEKTILELACGTGYWTEVMSRTACQITAIDAAPEMVAEARAKRYGCHVDFIVDDMFSHEWQPARFDLIALGFWFSHHSKHQYQQLFKLLKKPLRKGGAIWIIDNNPPAEGGLQDSAGNDEHGNHLKVRRLKNGQEHVIIKNYFSPEELVDIFSDEFVIRELVYNTYYWSVVLGLKE